MSIRRLTGNFEDVHSVHKANTAAVETTDPLSPLTTAYFKDNGRRLAVHSWADILDPEDGLNKIAEGSYAEVYRVQTGSKTSIIKVMPLKVDTDPQSLELYTAAPVSSLVAEVRIMNALAEIPGFIKFKEVYLVRGVPSAAVIDAHDKYHASGKDESHFIHPTEYNPQSTFLVLELADAGNELTHVRIKHIDEIWDILLGVILALSFAEDNNDFEAGSNGSGFYLFTDNGLASRSP